MVTPQDYILQSTHIQLIENKLIPVCTVGIFPFFDALSENLECSSVNVQLQSHHQVFKLLKIYNTDYWTLK